MLELLKQETCGLFEYSIITVYNDDQRSAERTVNEVKAISHVPIVYCNEPRQNIARARNKAVEIATGEFIAFIDDDEFPTKRWLLTLWETLTEHGVDGVLGPVKPHFSEQPPSLVVKGRFYDRPCYPTGFLIDG